MAKKALRESGDGEHFKHGRRGIAFILVFRKIISKADTQGASCGHFEMRPTSVGLSVYGMDWDWDGWISGWGEV